MRRVALLESPLGDLRTQVDWILAALREIERASNEEALDDDPALSGNNDKTVPSQAAVKAYVDGRTGARAIKPADVTITSDDSLNEDAALQFAVAAATKYHFRFVIFFDTAAAADFKYDVNGPASPDVVSIHTRSVAPAATAYGGIATQTAFGFGPTAITAASGTAGVILIDGILHNGANAGTVVFRWAQNTSNGGSTIVRAGSYVEWSALP